MKKKASFTGQEEEEEEERHRLLLKHSYFCN